MIPFSEFTREDRLFTLNTEGDPDDFFTCFTGRAPDGRQVLQGPYCGDDYPYVAGQGQAQYVWFDPEGRLQFAETVTLQITTDPPSVFSPGPDISRGSRTVRRHMGSLGVVPGPIRVRHFWLDEPFRMCLSLLPSWLPEQMWDPYSLGGCNDLAEALSAVNVTASGVRFGDFFLFWGEGQFGFWGDTYPYDHPDRELPAGPPLHLFPDRLRTLRTCGAPGADPYYYTGTLPDGRQGLMGGYLDDVVCMLFDPAGALCESLGRPSGFQMEAVPPGVPFPVLQHEMGCRAAEGWQAELGWRPGPVRVKPFMHPDRRIFLSDLSRGGVTTCYDPFQDPDADDREEAREQLAGWLASGYFVLNWLRDYHLDEDGNVIST